MKILIIGWDPFVSSAGIGPPIFVRNLLEGFSSFSQHKIFSICFKNTGRNEIGYWQGLKIYRIKEPGFLKTILTPLLLKKKVQEIISEIRPDIIDLHMPHKAMLLKGIGVPFVVTLHGIVPEQLKHGKVPGYKSILFPLYKKLWFDGLRMANCIICLNKYDITYLENKIKTKLVTIPIPRSERYFVEKEEERGKLLNIGILSEVKNQLNLVKAIDKVRQNIPNVKLYIIGYAKGVDSLIYKEKLLNYIQKNNLKKNVAVILGMENDQIISEFSSTAIYVQFSRQETFPSAVVEALASGTPVIASDIPGSNEAVIDGKTGYLVPSNDIIALSEKIKFLLLNDDLRKEMGLCAREYARNNFLAQNIVKQRIELYETLIK